MSVYLHIQDTAGLAGSVLKTPDGKVGKPFRIAAITAEGIEVGTASGGRWTIMPEAFEVAMKYLEDLGHEGDSWMDVKDMTFQELLKAENKDRPCVSYVLPVLERCGLIEIDRGRPNRVRLAPDRTR